MKAFLSAVFAVVLFCCSPAFAQDWGGGAHVNHNQSQANDWQFGAAKIGTANPTTINNYGMSGAAQADLALYDYITGYYSQAQIPPSPYGPLNINTSGYAVATYNLTGYTSNPTTIASGISGAPALTISGSPTVATSGITFTGGAYATAPTSGSNGIYNGGNWSIIAVVNMAGTSNTILSLTTSLGSSNYSNEKIVYNGATSGGMSNQTLWSYSGGGSNVSANTTSSPGGTFCIVMISYDQNLLTFTNLSTGQSWSVKGTGGSSKFSSLGVGCDVLATNTNVADSVTVSYIAEFDYIPTLQDQKNTYGFLSNLMSSVGVHIPQWSHPSLATNMILPDNGLYRSGPPMGYDTWMTYGPTVTSVLMVYIVCVDSLRVQ